MLIASSIDRIVLAFKGTISRNDIKMDIKFIRTPLSNSLPTIKTELFNDWVTVDWKNAKVHKGFFDGYCSVSNRIIERMSDLLSERPRSVLLTGHSLGGTLATFCSLDLSMSLGIAEGDVLVSTFGSPKVGNFAWRSFYDKKVSIHWRVAVYGDVLTLMPPLGYYHVGKRVLLKKSGDIFFDPNSLESAKWAG